MQNLVTFVQEAIVSGVAGSVAYDGLKTVLGSSYDRLSTYLSNNETEKFEGALEMLLEENQELKQQIEQLQQGRSITYDNSVKIGGNNSGNIVTGNNNTVIK
jgi:hypothetical protein